MYQRALQEGRTTKSPEWPCASRDLGLVPAGLTLPNPSTWRHQDYHGTSLQVSSHSIPRLVARGRLKLAGEYGPVNPPLASDWIIVCDFYLKYPIPRRAATRATGASSVCTRRNRRHK